MKKMKTKIMATAMALGMVLMGFAVISAPAQAAWTLPFGWTGLFYQTDGVTLYDSEDEEEKYDKPEDAHPEKKAYITVVDVVLIAGSGTHTQSRRRRIELRSIPHADDEIQRAG